MVRAQKEIRTSSHLLKHVGSADMGREARGLATSLCLWLVAR